MNSAMCIVSIKAKSFGTQDILQSSMGISTICAHNSVNGVLLFSNNYDN